MVEFLYPIMLSKPIQQFISACSQRLHERASSPTDVNVHVDEIALKIASLYEQIRSVVDYREEHLLRKNYILRSLQRNLLVGNREKIGEALVKEIIRAGHLPNDSIPEARIRETQKLIDNLFFLLDRVESGGFGRTLAIKQWLVRVTASAVEETLDPPHKDGLVALLMFDALKERCIIKMGAVDPDVIPTLLWIGIQRALLRVDEDQLNYRVLTFLYPMWNAPTAEELWFLTGNITSIYGAVGDALRHPKLPLVLKLCHRVNTIFSLLGDALSDGKQLLPNCSSILEDPQALDAAITEAYKRRCKRQRRILRRLAFFSIISLFITKVIVAIAVEIPIDRYLTNDFSLPNTLINILFPPLLMLILILLIRLPSKRNLPLILTHVHAVVDEEKKIPYIIVVPKEKSAGLQFFVYTVYALIAVAVLYAITSVLDRLDFSIASSAVFIFFTSIVAATGVRVHNRAKDLSLEESKPSLAGFFTDLLFMPFVTIGQWTINGLSKFRLLVILVDLLDAPFVVFITFIENFNAFLRSKKEELQ